MQQNPRQTVRFAAFELDLEAGVLRRSGVRLPVQGRPLQVLAVLLRTPGELVTAEQLRTELWPADTFVDFDHGVRNAVARLRAVLGDSADRPRFVETVPRRGYRFIGALSDVAVPAAPVPQLPAPMQDESQSVTPRHSWRTALVACTSLVVLAALGGWIYSRSGRNPADAGIRVLAVFPFENSAKDEDAEFLCDGVTQSLIRQLASLPALTVKRGPKGKTGDPLEAGRRLKADAIVTGSVARRSGKILLNLELVDARTGTVLWSSPPYDSDEADLLRTQDEIVRKIIDDGIRLKLSGADRRRLGRQATADPEAMQLFMRAIYHHAKESEADFLAARPLLLQAVEKDKNFALAYWALAKNYSLMAVDGYVRPSEAWPISLSYARHALALDSTLPEPHANLGMEAFCNRWNWAEAEREFELALSAAEPDVWMPCVLERWAVGRNDDALRLIRQALDVEPVSVVWRLKEADLLLQTGQVDTAGKLYESIIVDAREDPRAYFGEAEVRRAQERFDDAIALFRQGCLASGLDDAALLKLLLDARGAEGYRNVEKMWARLELDVLADRAAAGKYTSPLDYARAHARVGDKNEAFRYLDAAFADKSPGLVFLKVDRAWDQIRNDARFRDAVKRIGFP
jgi:TolB-like protein/DNA-binding winged helix-turn-helix (wHTH) protein